MSTFVNESGDEVTRDQLKVMALRERIAQITAEYEDKIAELRIELTIVSQELEQVKGAEPSEG